VDKDDLNEDFVNKLDKTILMTLPDAKERELFIRTRLAQYPVAGQLSETSILNFATRTVYYSFGDINAIIEFLMKNSRGEDITDKALLDAIDSYELGEGRKMNKDEELRTAYHEIGHILLFYLCGGHPTFVTIVRRGDFCGYAMPEIKEERMDKNRQEYLDSICSSYGGRVAETLVYGETIGTNSGFSGDIASATRAARIMVCYLGMGKSLISMDAMGSSMEIPQSMIEEIDAILHEQYERATKLLSENRDLLEVLAKRLYQEKFLAGSEIEKIINETRKAKKK